MSEQQTDGRKVAIVTGASGGIGEAFARELSERGHDLVLVARRQDRLQALANALGKTAKRVDCIALDLGKENAPSQLWAQLDALKVQPVLWVNNAGAGRNVPAIELTDAQAVEMLRLNVETVTLLTLEAARRMTKQGGGGVINVSSTGGFGPLPYMAVYGATKGYQLLMSEAINEELRGTGVRIFTVCPGYTETEFHQLAGVKARPPKALVATPEQCVKRALAAYDAQQDVHIDGFANSLIAFMQRLMPRKAVAKTNASVMKPAV